MRSRPKTKKHEWMNEWNWTTYVCDPSNSGANGTTACYAVVFSIDQRMRENRTRARGAQSRLSNQSDRWMDNVRTFKIPRDKDVMAMRGPGMHMDNTQHKVYLYSINRFFFSSLFSFFFHGPCWPRNSNCYCHCVLFFFYDFLPGLRNFSIYRSDEWIILHLPHIQFCVPYNRI